MSKLDELNSQISFMKAFIEQEEATSNVFGSLGGLVNDMFDDWKEDEDEDLEAEVMEIFDTKITEAKEQLAKLEKERDELIKK